MGTLYLVATPIGNLEDITARALRILGEVSLIAAEDTRLTSRLLQHYAIHTPLTSYFEHNKLQKVDQVLAALKSGDVALVSDAGMPGLNDPGFELVRAAVQAGCAVSPVPGASAPLAALVVSGLPADAFLYLGYLPRKSGERRRALEAVAELPYTLVFLEAPHRLVESLDGLLEALGDRQAAAARELTKLHEQILRGKLSEIRAHFTSEPARGEFTLVVAGAPPAQQWSEERLYPALRDALAEGGSPSQIAASLAEQSGWPRRKIYELALQEKAQQNS